MRLRYLGYDITSGSRIGYICIPRFFGVFQDRIPVRIGGWGEKGGWFN